MIQFRFRLTSVVLFIEPPQMKPSRQSFGRLLSLRKKLIFSMARPACESTVIHRPSVNITFTTRKKTPVKVSFWWTEVDSNHRSLRRQIYSLIHLAALESVRFARCSDASCGAGDWTRTHNLLITNQLLCQLSYTGAWCLKVESNRRQRDFQSLALPTELSRRVR